MSAPTVQQAWAAVMAEVRELSKDQRNSQQGFNFRGVDDVMNAVGPALRKHGVSVVPVAVEHKNRDVTTNKGAVMREVTVVVSYAINGPAGDSMPGAAAGEAADSGDKATPKAMSVAYRTFLLQSLTLPTQEADPDTHTYERAATPAEPTREELVAAAVHGLMNAEDEDTVRLWGSRIHTRGLSGAPVVDTGTGAKTLEDLARARLALFTQAGAA